MHEITIRELRNHGGDVIDRVVAGEVLTVTRDGRPVAELRPLPPRAISSKELVRRWRHLKPLDAKAFREDLDSVIDPDLFNVR